MHRSTSRLKNCRSRHPSLLLSGLAGGLLILALAGCASPKNKAPVEDRGAASRPGTSVTAAPAAAPELPVKLLPGAENAGKPGYYTVQRGDTMIRIGLDSGQNWRDIARWNAIDNPNLIEVGQVLRVVPPGSEPGLASTRPVAPGGRADIKPLDPRAAAVAASAPAGVASAASTPVTAAAAAPSAAAKDGDDDLNWMWPAAGPVATAFDDNRSKGLAIAGKAGDPVLAAADGRVVYAGSGLRGYGNLVIVKHNAIYLSAYAHNQVLLVKEDQAVRRGQKIAEMGSSDAESVQLHFEIRRQGKPIDPAKLLPPR
jgi:lipoprotein NlpD